MPKVFLHTFDAPGALPRNEGREFLRLPVVGEFVTLSSDSPWYEVSLVVHCAFDGDYAAEVYARQVDHANVLRKQGSWPKGPGVIA